jgi:hypothetical protein
LLPPPEFGTDIALVRATPDACTRARTFSFRHSVLI